MGRQGTKGDIGFRGKLVNNIAMEKLFVLTTLGEKGDTGKPGDRGASGLDGSPGNLQTFCKNPFLKYQCL